LYTRQVAPYLVDDRLADGPAVILGGVLLIRHAVGAEGNGRALVVLVKTPVLGVSSTAPNRM
jgi:hypothetical protein